MKRPTQDLGGRQRKMVAGKAFAAVLAAMLLFNLACNFSAAGARPPQLPSTITPVEQQPSSTTVAPPTVIAPTATGTIAPAAPDENPKADLGVNRLLLGSGGQLMVEFVNHGPDPLEQAYLQLSVAVIGGPGPGPAAPTRMWVQINPGGAATIDSGFIADLSKGGFTATVTFSPEGFADHNPSNNSRTQVFAGQSGTGGQATATASPEPGMTMLPIIAADLTISGIQGLGPSNPLKLAVTNNGPSALNGVTGSLDCFVTRTPAGGGAPAQESVPVAIVLTLASGQTYHYTTGITADFTVSQRVEIACSVSSQAFDPNSNNNDFYVDAP